MYASFVIAVLMVFTASDSMAATQSPSCGSAAECRQLAMEAAERQDYEAFHTLAWRAVQTGRPNDPTLMYLLARAQSLSGRPLDALVMLRRLVDLKFAGIDAEANEDFRRVRALPEWPALLERIHALTGRPSTSAPPAPAPPAPAPPATAPAPEKPAPAVPTPEKPAPAAPAPATPDPPTPTPATPKDATIKPPATPSSKSAKPTTAKKPAARTEEVTLPATLPLPAAMGYDAVSRRFVVTSDSSETLSVIDEQALKAVTLVSARSIAPFRPTALAIDARSGDLWVSGAHADSNGVARSALHRLQLVSGRLLHTVPVTPEAGATRFASVALSGASVYVLDAHSRRVFQAGATAKSLRVHLVVEGAGELTSLAAGEGTDLFVADANGILRFDTETRTSAPLAAGPDVNLGGVQWMAYHDGSLLAIQKQNDNKLYAVRIQLKQNRAAAMETLGEAASRAASLAGTTFYFLATDPGGAGMRVRRIALR